MLAAAVGCSLGHYRLERPLGYGGTGLVFLATDTRRHCDVAIKLSPSDRLDRRARQRLRDEALTLALLTHPNVAAVLDFGSHGDIDYLVMEYVPGATLDVLLKQGPVDGPTVASLGAQLGRGLEAAHACGIIHRDIKPGNVRVTPDGTLKILDFSDASYPASRSATGSRLSDSTPGIVGTLQYMPPERLRGVPAGPRADIFSAGAVLYEMACGRPPYSDPHPVRLIESILCGCPPRPSAITPRIDRGLESVILRALDPDPDRRFARAIDLAGALEALPRKKLMARCKSPTPLNRWVTRLASSFMA
jgi:serine/threonine protein kinase